jgi:arylsulfatase A-like enzyme
LVQKGCRFYEGLVRVPLLWSWPGHLTQGQQSDALVELTDIVPTLLDLAGLPVPQRVQGRSLLPILIGAAEPGTHRPYVRSEFFGALGDPPNRTPGAEGTTTPGTYATMIRDRNHKLVVYHGLGAGELFDLQEDPEEFVNLWDSPAHAGVRFELVRQSFDALALATDVGPPKTAGF